MLTLRDNPSKTPLTYRRIIKRKIIKSNITETSYVRQNSGRMDDDDRLYERTHPYVNMTLSMKQFKHLANEKAVLNMYTAYQTNTPVYAHNCSCKIL